MRKGADIQVELVEKESPFYPAVLLEEPWATWTPGLWVLGNLEILRKPLLGFLCSVRCPGDAILRTYDAARALRDAGIPVIGGFHSPMEKECLAMLLKGTQPVVICPARSILNMKVPELWRKPLGEGRLLVLSPFSSEKKRMTAELAEARNHLVGALAKALLVAHAGAGSLTEGLALELLSQGKVLFSFRASGSSILEESGAQSLDPGRLVKSWHQIG